MVVMVSRGPLPGLLRGRFRSAIRAARKSERCRLCAFDGSPTMLDFPFFFSFFFARNYWSYRRLPAGKSNRMANWKSICISVDAHVRTKIYRELIVLLFFSYFSTISLNSFGIVESPQNCRLQLASEMSMGIRVIGRVAF